MAWASLLQTAQHHQSVHGNSLVRIITLLLLFLTLLITISRLKRVHVAGIKVSMNIKWIISNCSRLVAFYCSVLLIFALRHPVEETMGVFSNRFFTQQLRSIL